MSISPINFNGMIQSSAEAANSRVHEDSKVQVQQAAVTIEISKREEDKARQVTNPDDARKKDSRYDREGDGKGYQKSSKKMLKKKSDKDKGTDGKVNVKPMSSFDVRI